MYKKIAKCSVLAGMLFMSILSYSQSRSPFTSRGIGDIYDLSLAHNRAMGGLGLSNGSYWNLNNMNPALLPYNTLTVFSAGLVMENRNISNETSSETSGGGSLSYLATAFPIKPGVWTTSIGLSPYSNVDYSYSFDGTVTNDTTNVLITESGSGGYNQFYWANGVSINKWLNIGVKATYLFSGIRKEFTSTLENTDDQTVFTPAVIKRTNLSDFMFQGSIAITKDSIFNSKVRLKFGATYDYGGDMNAEQLSFTELQINGRELNNTTDTLSSEENGIVTIPSAFGAGLSFNNGTRWVVGVDVRYQPWSEYKDFEGNTNGMDDAYKIVLGGEFTPDPTSVTSYFKRVTYRMGLSYENTPYVINGNQVKDFGINFGWSLPVSRFSSIDMAFKYGQRGNVSDNLIKEDYFNFTFGVTFNDQWFIKRKYD